MTVGGQPLAVDTRKAVALLALLAVDGRQSRDLLAGRLWPDSPDARARGALRRTLSVLNAGLGGAGVITTRDGVELATEDVTTDVGRWTEALAETGAHGHARAAVCPACLAPLTQGVELHRGDFLAGFALRDTTGFEDWQSAQVERYRRELCSALDRLTRAEVEADELDAATAHAERWLGIDPLNEQVHGRLMLLHAWRGQRAEAIQRYRDCVALLDRELGVRPLEATTRLYRSVLDGEVVRPERARRPAPRPPDARPVDPFGDPPFVGRSGPLEAARAHLGQVPGAIVAVEGEAGAGKTRFVDELEAALHRADVTVATARCHAGEASLTFGAAIDLLRSAAALPGAADRVSALPVRVLAEAGRLLPELVERRPDVPAPSPLDAPGARAGFLDALAQVLDAGLGPSARRTIVVEDVHAADEATTDLLTYLVHRGVTRRCAVVLTSRSAELPEAHPLRRLPRDTDLRGRWRTIELGRLDADATTACCAGLLGDRPDLPAISERLHRESEGLPLALVEYLRWLASAEPDLTDDWPIPTGVRDLLRARLEGLSEVAGQVVTAAAVLAHGFEPGTLAATAGRSEDETLEALDELLARGLLSASTTGLGSYDFSHDKARAVAYEETSLVRRRLLHARAAEALANGPGAARELAAVIAEHARLGGREDLAATWAVLAGDHARSLFANREARDHYERALALGVPDPAAVHARIARLLVLDGDYGPALDRFELAAALAADDATFAAVEHEIGGLHLRRRQWTAARVHLETGLARAGEQPTLAARLTADLGLVTLNEDDVAGAARLAEDALALAEAAGDRQALAQARNLGGLLARRRGDVAAAHRHLEHAAALASTLEDPSAYIAALNNLAMTTAEAGESERAQALLEQALQRCGQQGDRHRQAAILNNLADLAHRAGAEDAAMDHLKRAVALFAEIGEPEVHEPEIWKLVSW